MTLIFKQKGKNQTSLQGKNATSQVGHGSVQFGQILERNKADPHFLSGMAPHFLD